MLAWILIYCPKSILDVSVEKLLEEIRLNDYESLVGDYHVKKDLIAPAMEMLAIESRDAELWFWYKEDRSQRPVIVQRWTEPDTVKEEVNTARQIVRDQGIKHEADILARLAKTTDIVGIEMGPEQLQDMGVVFAYEIARWFGENRHGLILGDDGSWSLVNDGAFSHVD